MTLQLTDIEKKIIEALNEKGRYSFEPQNTSQQEEYSPHFQPEADENRKIRAEVIRALLYGEISLDDGKPVDVFPSLELESAWIEGELNLKYFRERDNTAAPSLIFKNCFFDCQINMQESSLSSLSLSYSKLVEILAYNATFNGSVDLSFISSSQSEKEASGCVRNETARPLCQIDLRHVIIHGSFTASGAQLASKPKIEGFDGSSGGTPYALMLRDSSINGDIILQPLFTAYGGVSLGSCNLRGDLWLNGAILDSECSEEALNLQYADVNGAISLGTLFRAPKHEPESFHAKGLVNLRGANIDGELYMAGAYLEQPDKKQLSLFLYMANVRKNIQIGRAEEEGKSVSFAATGGLDFRNLTVNELMIEDAELNFINLVNANVSNNITIDNVSMKYADPQWHAVVGNNMKVGGHVYISMKNMEQHSIDLRNASVSKHLSFINFELDSILMQNCRVGGSLEYVDVTLTNRRFPLLANYVTISGSLELDMISHGTIRLSPSTVNGQLQIRNLVFKSTRDEKPKLELNGSNIKGGIYVSKIESETTEEGSFEKSDNIYGIPLPFYPRRKWNPFASSWKLIEAESTDKQGNKGVRAYLWDGKGRIKFLPGTSPPIHEFNATSVLKLNLRTVRQYLEFFCNYIWGDEGAFRLVRDKTILDKAGVQSSEYLPHLALNTKKDGKNYRIDAIVHYSNVLFAAKFLVYDSGMVEMLDDTPLEGVQVPQPFEYKNQMRLQAKYIENSSITWPPVPLYPGQWNESKKQRIIQFISSLSENDNKTSIQVFRMRTIELSFWPGHTLVQLLVAHDGQLAIRSYVHGPGEKITHLDGTSPPIHALNTSNPPSLETESKVKDYVKFFGFYVWGAQEGMTSPFFAVENEDELPFAKEEHSQYVKHLFPFKVERDKDKITCKALVIYAARLFSATFILEENGAIGMLDDTQLPQEKPSNLLFTFTPKEIIPEPRIPVSTGKTLFGTSMSGNWKQLSPAEKKQLEHTSKLNAVVSLREVYTPILSDRGGSAWGQNTQLDLSGFTYDYISKSANVFEEEDSDQEKSQGHGSPESITEKFTTGAPEEADDYRKRLKWLARQYSNGKPVAADEHSGQSYGRLLEYYQKVGRHHDAEGILTHRLNVELKFKIREWERWPLTILLMILFIAIGAGGGVLFNFSPALISSLVLAGVACRYLPRFAIYIFKQTFRYGLSWKRAVATFAVSILIGWWGVDIANRGAILTPSLSFFSMEVPSQKLLDLKSQMPILEMDIVPTERAIAQKFQAEQKAIIFNPKIAECGEEIEPLLYAIDVFIPLLDLRQEVRCSPSTAPKAWGWRMAKAAYAILGWIITSLTILTIAGVIRRRIGG